MIDMPNIKDWLPPTISHNGCDDETIEKAFEVYYHDFYQDTPIFMGMKVIPLHRERERDTFCHIITKKNEKLKLGRLLSISRCCAVPQIAPVINHYQERFARIYYEKIDGQRRVCIWYQEIKYVIILIEKDTCFFLLTAYTLDSKHEIRKHDKSYKKSKKNHYSI